MVLWLMWMLDGHPSHRSSSSCLSEALVYSSHIHVHLHPVLAHTRDMSSAISVSKATLLPSWR
jgi:hypothetical protein